MHEDRQHKNDQQHERKGPQRKNSLGNVLSVSLLLLVFILPIFYIATDGFTSFPLGEDSRDSVSIASGDQEERPVAESVHALPPMESEIETSEESPSEEISEASESSDLNIIVSVSEDVSQIESSVVENSIEESSMEESTPPEEVPASEEPVPETSVEPPAGAYAQGSADTSPTVQSRQGAGANHNTAAGIYAYSVAEVKEAMFGGQALDGDKKIAFLTFDDGISSSTDELLDILNREGVPATFFLLGTTIGEGNRPELERMYNEGHAIALHSYNHRYESLYPGRSANPNEIVYQYDLGISALKSVLGDSFSTAVWRYPGGHMSWSNMGPADDALYNRGVHWIDWNSFNADAEANPPTTVQGQVDSVFDGWKAYGYPSAIVVLMHDTPDKKLTRQALPTIIQSLRAEGFSFGIME